MKMVSPAPKPHVVMMPYPLQGHITPLMQLSKLLAARGFAVTFVSSKLNVKKMLQAKQDLKARDLNTLGIELVGIDDGLMPEIQELEVMVHPEAFLASLLFLHSSFDALVERMVQDEGLTITCIISDSFLTWTQDVANKWRIPRVSFWPNSLAAFACSLSLPNIMVASPHQLDPFKPEVHESADAQSPLLLLNCIPGIPEIDMCSLPFHTLGGELSEEWLREQVQSQIQRVNEPVCMIANSFPDLEKEIHMQLEEVLPSKSMFTLGPLLPSSFLGGQQDDGGTGSSLRDEDEECMEWLDKQSHRSVLYISMGSVAVMEERVVEEIALGVEASQQPFLWVLTQGSAAPPPLMKGTQGKVIRWAPQLKVLSHEAVGGFLTHCGWNSTLESLSMGVPVIVWPQMMDQFTNCWFLVEKLKVGVRLEVDEAKNVGRASVEKAVRTLMQDEGGLLLRARAAKFQALARSAFTTSLPSNLDSLVNTIMSPSKPVSDLRV